ncbi:MAG: hypothetical protein N3G19_01585 [Candidatus Pacearchaeota archaeon]|nr:hypothetical protein [Candidatus Pacearchaeota archaeon]
MRLYNFLSIAVSIAIAVVIVASNVDAACISLGIIKNSYLPQETVQLEINADLIKDITTGDIFLYRNNIRIPVTVFLSKVSGSKWFAWFDLPVNDGDYNIQARGNCKDGSVYVASMPLKVEMTVASSYNELKNSVKNKFSSLSIEEHLLSAIALQESELADEAFVAFTNRKDSCLKVNCSAKFNALTLMAFKDSLLRQKMSDALEASQNYVKKGSWLLKLNSSQQECNISINNASLNVSLASGENKINLDFSNVSGNIIFVKTICQNNVNGKLIYSYKQFSKEFIQNGNNLQFSLENSGCFVSDFNKTFSNNCDSEATTYALLALKKTNKFNEALEAHQAAVSWLKNQAQNIEEKSIIYYITKDSNNLEELLSSQSTTGWWPKTGTYQPDIFSSSLAILALKNGLNNETPQQVLDALKKGEKWLLNKTKTSVLKDKATILAFAFSAKDIEPILAFWPGIIKTSSLGSFDLMLQNKGLNTIVVETSLLNSTISADIEANTLKNLHFNIPLITTIDGRTLLENLIINYRTKISDKNFEYVVPVLIFTQKATQEQLNGSINASEQEINESKQQEIINETKELENKTAEINKSLLSMFRFIERNVSLSAEVNKPVTVKVNLKNQLDKDVTKVSLTYSIQLSLMEGEIKITPNNIDVLKRGETKEISLYFLPANSGSFDGEIIVTADYNGQQITTALPVAIDVAAKIKKMNCSEMGGKICEGENEICEGNLTESQESFACCIPAESCKKKGEQKSVIALIIVLIVIIILLAILAILKRKPKKEMREFLKETSEAYEKRFQRPPTIAK